MSEEKPRSLRDLLARAELRTMNPADDPLIQRLFFGCEQIEESTKRAQFISLLQESAGHDA